ncbi:MAG: NTP transferase domain-containing protein [candidate division Zixibacteria bacterium]|nr:NTP transferase domain-containing protein [candidate division Zixibacteria bacterium]
MDEAVALIQARLGSSRLRGKVLLPLAGRPALAHVVERCRAAPGVGGVVVATTEAPEDDAVAACGRASGAEVFRGSGEDVLGRVAGAAQAFPARDYVRITADCPLTDPQVVAAVLAGHRAGTYDFSYNEVPTDFPRGYDVEVIKAETLTWLAAHCQDPTSREHVTAYLFEHGADFKIFKLPPVRPGADFSRLRLVLDEPPDYELLRRIFDRLAGKRPFGLADVLELFEAEPALAEINRDVAQKEPPRPPRVKK